MEIRKILIADDEYQALEGCLKFIEGSQGKYDYTCVATPSDCLQALANNTIDAVLLDISFSRYGKEGLTLLQKIKAKQKSLPVIMLSTHDDNQMIAQCMQHGADDFISKTYFDGAQEIVSKLDNLFSQRSADTEVVDLGRQIAKENNCVSESPAMTAVFKEVAIARRNWPQNVMIEGETGVGKDRVAFAISDPKRPFVVFNCACLSESLADSQLFGHVKGAFTGASRTIDGKFEQADGGDLFLDEVARLPLSVQGKLLRVLQTGDMYKLGSTEGKKVDVRVICASNENIPELIKNGQFREDLYQRINKINIEIPPLRERKSDIAPLMSEFAKKFKDREITFARDLQNFLTNYDWPGNIRELESTIEYMICNSKDGNLSFKDLPKQFFVQEQIVIDSDAAYIIDPDLPLKAAKEKFEQEYVKSVVKSKFLDHNRKITVRELAKTMGISKSMVSKYSSIIETMQRGLS